MVQQLKQAFTNPKFVVGFVIFVLLLITAFVYPLISIFEPLEYVATGYEKPGTYVNIVDATNQSGTTLNVDTSSGRLAGILTDEQEESMIKWMVDYGGVDESEIDVEDAEAFLNLWLSTYDPNAEQDGLHLTVSGYNKWVSYLCTHVPYNKNNPYQAGSTYYLSDELQQLLADIP